MAARGARLSADATPSLAQLLRNVSRSVADPNTGKTLYDAWEDSFLPSDGRVQTEVRSPYVGALGSGSDFVSFVNYIGVPAVNLAFRGDYGVYRKAALNN